MSRMVCSISMHRIVFLICDVVVTSNWRCCYSKMYYVLFVVICFLLIIFCKSWFRKHPLFESTMSKQRMISDWATLSSVDITLCLLECVVWRDMAPFVFVTNFDGFFDDFSLSMYFLVFSWSWSWVTPAKKFTWTVVTKCMVNWLKKKKTRPKKNPGIKRLKGKKKEKKQENRACRNPVNNNLGFS